MTISTGDPRTDSILMDTISPDVERDSLLLEIQHRLGAKDGETIFDTAERIRSHMMLLRSALLGLVEHGTDSPEHIAAEKALEVTDDWH